MGLVMVAEWLYVALSVEDGQRKGPGLVRALVSGIRMGY